MFLVDLLYQVQFLCPGLGLVLVWPESLLGSMMGQDGIKTGLTSTWTFSFLMSAFVVCSQSLGFLRFPGEALFRCYSKLFEPSVSILLSIPSTLWIVDWMVGIELANYRDCPITVYALLPTSTWDGRQAIVGNRNYVSIGKSTSCKGVILLNLLGSIVCRTQYIFLLDGFVPSVFDDMLLHHDVRKIHTDVKASREPKYSKQQVVETCGIHYWAKLQLVFYSPCDSNITFHR